MMRLRNWPSRFSALVESVRAQPFEWGTHDCCMWAANATLSITGADPAATWRGTYAGDRGALRLLDQLGGLESVGALTGPVIALPLVTVGDVGLVTWPDGTRSLGVCGGTFWLCAGDAGLISLPMDAASMAWGVGRE